MTREIKFRSWGKDSKEFIYVELKHNASVQDNSWRYNGYDEWEQYTGLKDKNGKEIYEGDIVKIEPFTKPFKVVFNKQYASFAGDNSTAGRLFNSLYSSDYEVVGNIHENPELLGGKE